MNRKTLKDWELEKGIIVKEKDKSKKYNEKQYKNLIKTNYIVIKTNKGLAYWEEIKSSIQYALEKLSGSTEHVNKAILQMANKMKKVIRSGDENK